MAFLDRYNSYIPGAFKQDEAGNTIFKPFGLCHKGFVVQDKTKVSKLQSGFKVWIAISFLNIFVATSVAGLLATFHLNLHSILIFLFIDCFLLFFGFVLWAITASREPHSLSE